MAHFRESLIESGYRSSPRIGTDDQSMMVALYGDEELMAMIRELEYKLQHKFLKQLLRDVAMQTYVKQLRLASPRGETGNLYRSFGTVTGKSRKNAVVFAGPRMGGKNRNWEGWVANIIEYNKGKERYPTYDAKYGRMRKRPDIPGYGIRRHSGKMPMRPFIHATFDRMTPIAKNRLITVARQRIDKIHQKYAKMTHP